jgi:Tol biopolymer transport system component
VADIIRRAGSTAQLTHNNTIKTSPVIAPDASRIAHTLVDQMRPG